MLAVHARNARQLIGLSALDNPRTDRLNQVMLVITQMLIVLAAVNAIFITWATVLDTRHPSALTRALGASPWQVAAGLSAAQLLPALPGAIPGIPAGIALPAAVNPGGELVIPSAWWLLAVVLVTVLALGALTAFPVRMSAIRPAAEILRSEVS